MNCFHKELHVTTVATATIIVSYANAVTLNVTLQKFRSGISGTRERNSVVVYRESNFH